MGQDLPAGSMRRPPRAERGASPLPLAAHATAAVSASRSNPGWWWLSMAALDDPADLGVQLGGASFGASWYCGGVEPSTTHQLVRDVLARTGQAWIRCEGVSMLPTVAPGTRLRVTAMVVRRGDVALLEEAGRLVVHRVVLRLPLPSSGGGLVLHAVDAWGAGARFVRASSVLGRVELPSRKTSWGRRAALLLVAVLRRARG
jgi:hypothetical protein